MRQPGPDQKELFTERVIAARTAYGNFTTTLSLVYFAVPGDTFENAPLSEPNVMAVKVEPDFGGTLVLYCNRNHAQSIVACDFLVVVTARFRTLARLS